MASTNFPYQFLSVLTLCLSTEAYTVFHTNCTLPPKEYSFVHSPNSRGTLDILWSSLFTIIACTWSVQHLNVPEQRLDRNPGWMGDFKWNLKGLWTKLKWMLGTVLAPEMVLAKAMGDLYQARKVTKSMQAFAREDNVQWTMTHSLLADLGGFAMSYGGADVERAGTLQSATVLAVSEEHERDRGSRTEEVPGSNTGTILDQYAQEAWEIEWWKENTEVMQTFMDGRSSHCNLVHLTAAEILRLRAERKIQLPLITEDDINEKSNSDTFAKAIAVGQILWNTVQIIARAIQRLPISQLELAVLAFSACAVVVYVLNWNKPKGPQIPYIVLRYDRAIPRDVLKCLEAESDGLVQKFFWDLDRVDFVKKRLSSLPIPNDYSSDIDEGQNWTRGLIGASTVFGALHVVAWNFAFPTRIEQIIWRATSIYITIPFPVMVTSYFMLDLTGLAVLFPTPPRCMVRAIIVSYILARLFLLIEIFRTLFFLPPEAFISTWSANIPHLS